MRYQIEPNLENYKVIQRNNLIAMCDFVGFSHFIMNTNFVNHSNFLATILGILKSYEKDIFKTILKKNPTLEQKLGKKWVDNFQLKTVMISDTFVIYPELECKTISQLEVTLQVISILISTLYCYSLEEWEIFLRGVISYGEYGTIEEYPLIYGKGLIETYYYEKMQDWSGIILVPSICKTLEKSLLLKYNFISYRDLPLKENDHSKKYLKECKENSINPYALNWIRYKISEENIINEQFWSSKIQNIENLQNEDEKISVKKKILNTKKFHDYVTSHDNLSSLK